MTDLTRRAALLAAAGVAVLPADAFAQRRGRRAAPAARTSRADQAFEALGRRWLDSWLRLHPVAATGFGDHRFDAQVDDASLRGREAQQALARRTLAELERTPRAGLSKANQIDAALLENQLRYETWAHSTLQDWKWDPLTWQDLAGSSLYSLVAREYAPAPQRLRAAAARMEALPTVLANARASLVPARTPRIHADTYKSQNAGIKTIIDGQILPMLDQVSGRDRVRLAAAAQTAKAAIDEHQRWIETVLVPGAQGDFRIGQALYDQKVAFALNTPMDRAEIKRRAEETIVRVRREMYAVARRVVAGRPNPPMAPDDPSDSQQQAVIEAALELAYADRPARDGVVASAEAALRQATDFVRSRDLITLPASPVRIILVPEFQRGVAVAYCDAPGPLDRDQPTFYKISPIPDDWTPQQADSFLREYNTRGIQETTVHEAMPGHYVQLAHGNEYPSILRAVLGSGPFVEGWACYAEDLMADEGYLNRDPLYLLVHQKLQLRIAANALLDIGVHVEGMTREQAITMMTRRVFQQEREAAGKWVRAQLSSAQLPTYFVGWTEHTALRREAQGRPGFNLKRYNDQVISYGAPPVRYVRQMMFDLPIA